ncbi:hypothetical protein EDD22DRAFT_962986 [Suillus occidentalis]|nr:hypothetical protein EDD22DRAFT_962986 [Suillus occidentalis]
MSGDVDSAALQEGLPSQSEQSMDLNNLAISLRARFKQQGTPSDIDEDIELYRGALADLDEATELHRVALKLRPSSRSLRFMSQQPCHQSSKNVTLHLTWMREAIKLYRAAITLRPPDRLRRSAFLYHLTINLENRSEQ